MPRYWLPYATAALILLALTGTVIAQNSTTNNGQTSPPTSPDHQTSPITNSQTTGSSSSTNPLVDLAQQKLAGPNLPGSQTLVDHRTDFDPSEQRLPRKEAQTLALYGYSFFEPAQQVILAQRAFYKRIFDQDLLTPHGYSPLTPPYYTSAAPPQPTAAESAAIANLTPAQKLDLLERQRDGKLTDEEKVLYRSYLYPNSIGPAGSGSTPGTSQPLISGANPTTPGTGPTGSLANAGQAPSNTNLPTGGTQIGPNGQPLNTQTSGNIQPQNPVNGAIGNGPTPQNYSGVTGPYNSGYPFPNYPPGYAPSQFSNGLSGQQGYPTDQYGMPLIQQLQSSNAYNQVIGPLASLYRDVIASAPTNYQLAAGDKITIRYSSPTLELHEETIPVDPTGGITVTGVGRVIVRGQTLAQAENGLQQRLQGYYRNVRVSVSLSELRTMPITVTGESFAPGTYQIPSVATALNVLIATGGPTEDGSLRHIEIRRNGKSVGSIDMYKLLLTGAQTGDIPLESGDVIYIPGWRSRVAVRGEVRHAAIYELLDNENLIDALRYAGGIKSSAVNQRIEVSTVQPGVRRVLKDVDASDIETAKAVPVYDGDVVDVFSVRMTLANKVSVEGAVDQPGEYAFSDGMKVADLVERARGLLPDAFSPRADLYRVNPDNTLTLVPINLDRALEHDSTANVALTRWDRLKIYMRQDVEWTGRRAVIVRGAVRNPGIYYFSDNMHVKDLLLQAGGTMPSAYTDRAVLVHQHPDGSYAYEFPNLTQAMKDDPKNNLPLQDRDVLAVYRTNEQQFTPEHLVSIQGEVVAPGPYPRGDNMHLSDLLKIAGGTTPRAGERIQVAHARTDQNQPPTTVSYSTASSRPSNDLLLQDGDVVVIQGRGSYRDRPYVVTVQGAVNNPGPVILSGPRVRISEVIKQAGGLKPEAYPEGVAFRRDPTLLSSDEQKKIAEIVNKLNDALNEADFQRKLAESRIQTYKAAQGALNSTVLPVNIPGIASSATAPAPTGKALEGVLQTNLVTPARKLTPDDLQPNGNVAVNLANALQHPAGDDDITMIDGDSITVPERPTTVQVIGAVVESRGVLYKPGATADYYVERAGGFTPDAAPKNRVLVIRAGGGLLPLKKVKEFLPGDVILVPTQAVAQHIAQHSNVFDDFFKSLTSSVLIIGIAAKLFGF